MRRIIRPEIEHAGMHVELPIEVGCSSKIHASIDPAVVKVIDGKSENETEKECSDLFVLWRSLIESITKNESNNGWEIGEDLADARVRRRRQMENNWQESDECANKNQHDDHPIRTSRDARRSCFG